MENIQTTNTPRDFFLHVSTFVVLYSIAVALATLIFTLIDYRFPDVLSGYYGDPYSGPVRFSIASLIILSPIFVILMRQIQKETRANPERAKLAVRKWLTYITLFIAGVTVIGDLITLLYSFLGGSLPTAFALKALALLIIAGAGFWYYFLDLKGFWQTRAMQSWYAAYGFLAVIAVSVIVGFIVMGSPATQRDIRYDMERRAHLESIQSQVVMYWQNNEKLPATVEELNNPLQYFTVPVDPETGEQYTYTVTSALSFEMCATFVRSSSYEQKGEFYPQMIGLTGGDNWKHDAGYTCFVRTIDTALIKPTPPIQMPIKR